MEAMHMIMWCPWCGNVSYARWRCFIPVPHWQSSLYFFPFGLLIFIVVCHFWSEFCHVTHFCFPFKMQCQFSDDDLATSVLMLCAWTKCMMRWTCLLRSSRTLLGAWENCGRLRTASLIALARVSPACRCVFVFVAVYHVVNLCLEITQLCQ